MRDQLEDAKRHPEAIEHRPILMIHDIFSFLSLLCLYSPQSNLLADDDVPPPALLSDDPPHLDNSQSPAWFTAVELQNKQNLDLNVLIERLHQYQQCHNDHILLLQKLPLGSAG